MISVLYNFVIVYFVIINIISILICSYDKYAAKKGRRRIPEKNLFSLCIFGGSISMYITMRLIRHKTKHKRFMLGIPLIFLVQISLLIFVLSNI